MANDGVLSGMSKDVTISMLKILAKYKKGLTLSHINAQSLNNKIDEFLKNPTLTLFASLKHGFFHRLQTVLSALMATRSLEKTEMELEVGLLFLLKTTYRAKLALNHQRKIRQMKRILNIFL